MNALLRQHLQLNLDQNIPSGYKIPKSNNDQLLLNLDISKIKSLLADKTTKSSLIELYTNIQLCLMADVMPSTLPNLADRDSKGTDKPYYTLDQGYDLVAPRGKAKDKARMMIEYYCNPDKRKDALPTYKVKGKVVGVLKDVLDNYLKDIQ